MYIPGPMAVADLSPASTMLPSVWTTIRVAFWVLSPSPSWRVVLPLCNMHTHIHSINNYKDGVYTTGGGSTVCQQYNNWGSSGTFWGNFGDFRGMLDRTHTHHHHHHQETKLNWISTEGLCYSSSGFSYWFYLFLLLMQVSSYFTKFFTLKVPLNTSASRKKKLTVSFQSERVISK